MAETNNLKLALPTSNEYVDVEVLNENFRKIDTSILLALAAAAPYSAAATYAQGAYCTKGGKLYRCTVAIPQAEAWNAAHWTATTMGAELVAIYTTLANKAPGGFGLGAIWNKAPENDANQIPGTGWFVAHQNTPNSGWWIIQEITDGTAVRYQYAFNKEYNSGVPGTIVCLRSKQQNKDWFPWEWINPPMGLNTEYRTTERYMGRSVYKKLVALGEAPSTKGTKEIFPFGEDYNAGTYNVFSVDAHISNAPSDAGWTITMPYFDNGNLTVNIVFSGRRIDFYSSGMAGYYGFALLKYTKEAD